MLMFAARQREYDLNVYSPVQWVMITFRFLYLFLMSVCFCPLHQLHCGRTVVWGQRQFNIFTYSFFNVIWKRLRNTTSCCKHKLKLMTFGDFMHSSYLMLLQVWAAAAQLKLWLWLCRPHHRWDFTAAHVLPEFLQEVGFIFLQEWCWILTGFIPGLKKSCKTLKVT